MTTAAIVIGLIAVFCGAVLQRISGIGVGLVAAPVFTLLAGPQLGVFVTNTATIISGLLIGLAVLSEVDWKRFGFLAGFAVLGAWPAALLVRDANPAILTIFIGGIVLIALMTTFSAPRLPQVLSSALTAAAGITASFLNTTAGVSAPAMVIYARVSRWPQRSFAATMQPTFMALAILSVTTKLIAGVEVVESLPPWWFFTALVAAVIAGVAVGSAAARRVSAAGMRRVAVVLVTLGALATVVRGIILL